MSSWIVLRVFVPYRFPTFLYNTSLRSFLWTCCFSVWLLWQLYMVQISFYKTPKLVIHIIIKCTLSLWRHQRNLNLFLKVIIVKWFSLFSRNLSYFLNFLNHSIKRKRDPKNHINSQALKKLNLEVCGQMIRMRAYFAFEWK